MNKLNLDEVRLFVNQNIVRFHENRIRKISALRLSELIKKNPYLFKAKNITKASELIDGTMSAFLSSSEEKMFGDFLEDLAIFVAEKTSGGHKSGASGVDLEMDDEGIHYFVSIKSGPNWGNSSQWEKLAQDLQRASSVFRQGRRAQVETVLGICYGKAKTTRHPKYGFLKLVGQNFWTFISGNKDLYKEIIEPVGYKAKEHNDVFQKSANGVGNRLTAEFVHQFCDLDGNIDWQKLIEANSGNYDLDQHGFTY
jgi:hypothetical protein